MALMSAMLLLLVTTILAVAMFRSFGLSEHLAGNTREKQRALHSAEAAQTYVEWLLTSNGGAYATQGETCPTSGGPVTQVSSTIVVCTVALGSVTTLPWTYGVSYVPTNMQVGAAGGNSGAAANYINSPAFYVQFVAFNYATGELGNISNFTYLIDATGAGGNTNSAAVVEDTYTVSVTYTTNPNGPQKFVNLGGS